MKYRGTGLDLGSTKITSQANGTASSDSAAFGQIPLGLTPNLKSAAYTAVAGDFVVCVAASTSYTITLPATATAGQTVAVRFLNKTGAYNITVSAGSNFIYENGTPVSSYVLKQLGQQAVFVWDTTVGGAWEMMNSEVIPQGGTSGQVLQKTGVDSTDVSWASPSSGGLTPTTKTANYTAVKGDLVLANAASAGFTVTLPASPSNGDSVAVKKTDSSSNAVVVVATGKTIDGDANATIVTKDFSGVFVYDSSSTNWIIQDGFVDTSTVPTPAFGSIYVSSRWYNHAATASVPGTTVLPATSGGLFVPYFSPQAVTISNMGIWVTVAGTSALVRFAVYTMDSATGKPASIIGQSASGASVVTGSNTSSISLVIPAGWSFLAIAGSNSGAPTVNGASSGSIPPVLGSSSLILSPAYANSWKQTASAFSANPTVTEVGTTTANAPLISFQVA